MTYGKILFLNHPPTPRDPVHTDTIIIIDSSYQLYI